MQNTLPCEAPLSLVYSDNNYFTNMADASGTSGTVDENLQVKQTCCSVKHMWLHWSAYVLHCTAYEVSCTEYVYTCYTVQHTCYTVQHMCYTVQHTNLQPTCSSHILPITPDGTHCPPPPSPHTAPPPIIVSDHSYFISQFV